jgi:GGDEF domain-containing protein
MITHLPPTSRTAPEERPAPARRPPRPAPQRLADLSQFAALLNRQLGQCRRQGICAAVLLLTAELPGADGPRPLSAATREALLEALGARLASRVRGSDVVVQLGADGFGLVLMEAGRPEAELVRERLLKALHGPYGVDEQRLELRLRIGAAVYREAGLSSGRELVEAAAADRRELGAAPARLTLVRD